MSFGNANDSITLCLRRVCDGDAHAAEQLWLRYFDRLVDLAKQALPARAAKIADEEDIALSVMDTLVRGAQAGRFEQLQNRSELWLLLVTITKRKAVSLTRRETRLKRGGGRTFAVSEMNRRGDRGGGLSLDDLSGDDLNPTFLIELDDQLQRLLKDLQDDTLREIARLAMLGSNSGEIALKLGISRRSVQRKLALIQGKWASRLLTR